MLYYNDDLLEGIPPDLRELAEIIIYCVYRQIDYKKWFNSDTFQFNENAASVINDLVSTLLEKKVFDVTYPEGTYRIELVKPLLVTEDISDQRFEAIRQMWSSTNINKVGWMGDKRVTKELFDKWRAANPEYSYDAIYKACEYYIKNTEMPHKFHNFIEQILSSVIEDVKTVKDVGKSTLI